MRRLNARSSAFGTDTTTTVTIPPKMDTVKLQFRTPTRLSLISRITTPTNPKQLQNRLWVSVFTATAAIAALFCLFVLVKHNENRRYGIVIDGGSTGTRIHVFAYVMGRGVAPVIDLGASKTMKVNPGLSAYEGSEEKAGDSLMGLLEFGRRNVPRDLWETTEVRLMATAGLRLLDRRVQDRILESCRRVMTTSGFSFRDEWASVISGPDEGIYAWVTANYALGSLGDDPQRTTGIIELGGASAQITFVTKEPVPPEFSHVLRIGKSTYNLYSHSFLHFGQNVAFESVHKFSLSKNLKFNAAEDSSGEGVLADPCSPRGYSRDLSASAHSVPQLLSGHPSNIHAAGNFSECRSAALMLLQEGKDKCVYKHCHLGSVFVPELQGKFLATENFFYTSKFFGVDSSAFLSHLAMAGEQFCGEDLLNLKRKYHNLSDEDLVRYCFSSAYIVALLHDSLGVALDEKRLGVANQIGDVPLDWALGAFIMQRISDPIIEQPDWITVTLNNNSSTLLTLFVILSVLIIAIWSVSKWRKPQLKTIYDLEKGRYIISRVSP